MIRIFRNHLCFSVLHYQQQEIPKDFWGCADAHAEQPVRLIVRALDTQLARYRAHLHLLYFVRRLLPVILPGPYLGKDGDPSSFAFHFLAPRRSPALEHLFERPRSQST